MSTDSHADNERVVNHLKQSGRPVVMIADTLGRTIQTYGPKNSFDKGGWVQLRHNKSLEGVSTVRGQNQLSHEAQVR